MKNLLLAVCIIFSCSLLAQHNNSELPSSIRTDGAAPHASAILDVQSTDKGILIPRTDTSLILSPAQGLLIYQNSNNQFYYHDGTNWTDFGGTGSSLEGHWIRSGNDLINDNPLGGRLRIEGNAVYINSALVSDAILSVDSNNRGFLLPTMSTTQRLAIAGGSPSSDGLTVYDTDTHSFWYWDTSISTWSELGADVNGAFENATGLVRSTGNHGTDDFVFGSDALPVNGVSTTDTMFFFDKSKGGAFRGGVLSGSENWSPENIGNASFAFGFIASAESTYSFAFGLSSRARSYGSISMGVYNSSFGYASTSMGVSTKSKAYASSSMGERTQANGYAGTVVGMYNDTLVSEQSFSNSSTPLFIVGNGATGSGNLSNAFVVRKDGNVGIGDINPIADLHVSSKTENTQILVTPVTTTSGDSSSIFLAEDSEVKYGMSILYDGADNQLKVFGKAQSVVSGPHFVIDRGTETKVGVGDVSDDHEFNVEGDMRTSGYSQLGSDAPKIKMKKYILTTPLTGGTTTNILHGLTASKILSIDATIASANSLFVPPGQNNITNCEYNIYCNSTRVYVKAVLSNSSQILNRTARIIITYEE